LKHLPCSNDRDDGRYSIAQPCEGELRHAAAELPGGRLYRRYDSRQLPPSQSAGASEYPFVSISTRSLTKRKPLALPLFSY
jgi:hypothetical protein